MGRAPCCDKANVKKGPWSPEEDSKLKEYINKFGTGGNWIALPQKAGLKRCGKSCRLRWLNYLRPNIKHGEFSDEEDRIICTLFSSIGSRWSIIAAQLPGRTDNDIKNYWNTKLKKKLRDLHTRIPPNSFTSSQIHRSKPPLFPPPPPSFSSLHPLHQSQPFHHHQPLSSFKDLNNMMTYSTYYTPTVTNPSINSGASFSSGFEILPNISTNYSLFQTEESLVGSMHYNSHPSLKRNLNNLIMFGSEGGCCTSSDGSYNNNNNPISYDESTASGNIKQEKTGMGFELEDQQNQNEKFMMLNNYGSSAAILPSDHHHNYDKWDEKPNGYNGNTISNHFGDYDFEDVKQMISSSMITTNDVVNSDNGTKTGLKEKAMYFY